MRAWTMAVAHLALSLFQWLTFLLALSITYDYVTVGATHGFGDVRPILAITLLFSIAAGVLKRDVGVWE